MIAYGEEKEISKTVETTDVPPHNTDVSLQKYIIKVNNNKVTGRENKRTKDSDLNADPVTVKDNISINNSVSEVNQKSENYKINNVVKIEAEDTVTYRIWVYNNSNTVDATNIVVKDRLPYYYLDSNNTEWKNSNNKGIAVSIETGDITIKNEDGQEVTYTLGESTENGCTELSWETSLSAKSSTYFDVTLKFNTYLDGIIENTAWISRTAPNNSQEYRFVDRDYVEMKKYSVSLEKYVTEVTDKDGKNKVPYNDREGYRHNNNLDDDTESQVISNSDVDLITYSPYKPSNKVLVETGDKVTFTIRLKNTGTTPVKVTQIYDIYTRVDNQLEFDSDYGIRSSNGTQVGTIVEDVENDKNHYTGPNQNWQLGDRYCHLIDFGDGILLQPEGKSGDHADVTIRFKVDVPTDKTNINNIELSNKAGIIEIQNRNGDVVPDSDGKDNNYDQDWLKLKTYAVSLEKYVSKVVD